MKKQLIYVPLTLSALAIIGVASAFTMSSKATPVSAPHSGPAAMSSIVARANMTTTVKQAKDDGEVEDAS